ncbi:MAG: hypothetical protein V7L21_17420 [Nostoc sp.]|nr:hypothetical protein [Nostoc sp. NMS9]
MNTETPLLGQINSGSSFFSILWFMQPPMLETIEAIERSQNKDLRSGL